jgi:DNA-binding MarR family transcriptional regulator
MSQRQDTKRDHVDRVLGQWALERPDLDVSPIAVIARLGRTTRYVDHALEQNFERYGLSRAGWDVLAALRRTGPPYRLSPTQLYRALMRTSGAMTNRLQRLEAGGLVARVADPADRRSTLVELTDRGSALFDEVATAHLATERRLLGALGDREQAALADLLKTLLLSYEADQPSPPATTA